MARKDFTPDNIELWICNYKRANTIDMFSREWLNSFDFERVNIIVNHSSVTIDDFADDIKPKIKIWNNILRHDDAVGPYTEDTNRAYIHTFMSGKRYCILSHDNMTVKKGWDDLIKNTDYELYMAPQGDQVQLMTREGLKRFGWWDERYSTNGNHEIDYLCRVLRQDIGNNRASLVDYHRWEGWPRTDFFDGTDIKNPIVLTGHPEFGNGFPYLRWNDIGLGDYWVRADKNKIPANGMGNQYKDQNLFIRGSAWNNKKWRNNMPNTYTNFINGPTESEIDWYPWSDLYV